MNARDFRREIVKSWNLLKDNFELGRAIVCENSLAVDEQFRNIALDESSTYEEIYKLGLSRSHYNFLLNDYAYFQFSLQEETSWRLAYMPNPWLSGVPEAGVELTHWETMEQIGALTHEEVSEYIGDMPYRAAVPPIRFEFAPQQYRELAHPAAHFHIGRHDSNRWSSAVALGPYAFTLQILKMYYSSDWASRSKFFGAAVDRCMDLQFMETLGDVRLVHDFSNNERQSLHFGKNLTPHSSPSFLSRLTRRVPR